MINIIIPGFAVNKEIFNEFLNVCPQETKFIDLMTFKYEELDAKLLDLIKNNNEKLNIFGWSLGSLFALKWAISHQECVSSLYLTGATARFCEKENYNNGITLNKIEQMLRLIKRRPEAVMTDFYNTVLENVKDKEKYLSIMLRNMPKLEALINGLEELINIDLLDSVHELKIPVYIFHGDYDKITPKAGASVLHDKITGSIFKSFTGGHCVFLECPEECCKTWQEFICTIK